MSVGPPKTGGSWWRGLTECGPLEKGMANHFSILAWRIPWTEEPGGQHPMGSQKVGHDWVTCKFPFICSFALCLSLLSLFALPSNYLGSLENKEQTSRKFTTRSFSITLLRKRTFFLYNQDIIIQFIFKCPHLSQRHLSEKLFPSPLIQDSTMDHVSLIPYTLV